MDRFGERLPFRVNVLAPEVASVHEHADDPRQSTAVLIVDSSGSRGTVACGQENVYSAVVGSEVDTRTGNGT